MKNYTPIFAGSKIVGDVRGDTFCKTIAPNHYLHKPPAIAFDVSSLEDAEVAGAVWVEVQDRETGTKYCAKISHIRKAGFEFNRGYGDQIYLVMEEWIKSKRCGGLQLDLWE